MAGRVAGAWRAAGHAVLVVAGDDDVARWARERDLEVIPEPPGGGLDGSAAAGVAVALARNIPWTVVHADLPLFDTGDASAVAGAIGPDRVVLAPSRDGGTNLIAATSDFEFSYGPGSFVRHLWAARHRERVVVVRSGTAVEIDTADDLVAASAHVRGRWLATNLGWPP
jgi:2-phospho-L-lactate guanylyltransferase